MHCAQAVGACISAADDNDPFARCENVCCGIEHIAVATLVRLGQILHRKMNSLQFAPRDIQIAWRFRSSGEEDCIELALEVFYWYRMTDVCVSDKLHAFAFHLLQTAVHDV